MVVTLAAVGALVLLLFLDQTAERPTGVDQHSITPSLRTLAKSRCASPDVRLPDLLADSRSFLRKEAFTKSP